MNFREFRDFQPFNAGHLWTLVIIVFCAFGLPTIFRRTRLARHAKTAGGLFGASLAINEIVWLLLRIHRDGFDVRYHLPLELCDVSMIAGILALWTGSQFAFEFAYFFGLGGATQALLTPDLARGFPDYGCMKFFYSHGGIVVAVAFLVGALRMRPWPRSILRQVVAGTAYMGIVGAFDAVAHTNYGYLCQKPRGPSLMDVMGPWPWYLGSIELIGLALVLILYAPFLISDIRQARGIRGDESTFHARNVRGNCSTESEKADAPPRAED